MALHDEDEMPYGKWKGTPMAEVPAPYLLRLYDTRECTGEVLTYIVENLEVIRNKVLAKKN